MPSLAMVFDLFARDRASMVFARVGAAAEGAGVKAEASSKHMRHYVEAIGAIAAFEIGKKMVEEAGNFQQGTNILVTAAGEQQSALAGIRKGIQDIAVNTGTPLHELTDGMYQVEKAGHRGADGLKILRVAAQGAREEGAHLATVTSAMTSIMASYHVPVSKSVQVMNEMKSAAGEAKTTMEAFSGSLNIVLPIASANHISFAKVAGSLASLTQHGTSADEAAQELANTMRNLAAPNMVAVREMQQLGISSQDVSKRLGQRGVAGTLEYLSETVLKKMGPSGKILLNTFMQSHDAGKNMTAMLRNMGPEMRKNAEDFAAGRITMKDWSGDLKFASTDQANLGRQFAVMVNRSHGFNQAIKNGLPGTQTYTEAIKKMTGGANGLNTTLQLTGESTAGTNERIKTIAESAKGAGKDVQGWGSTQKLFNVQLDQFKERVQVLGVRIGTALMPRILSLTKGMSSLLDFGLKNSSWLVPLAAGIAGFAATLFIANKAVAAYTTITKIAGAATKIWAGIQWLLNVAMDANPIGLVVVAIGALVVGLIYAYKHSKTFRDIIAAIGHWFVSAGKDIIQWGKDFGHWVADGFHKVVAAAKNMWSGIVQGAQGLWSGVTSIFHKVSNAITGAVADIVSFVQKHWRLLITIILGPLGFIIVLVVNHWKQIHKAFNTGVTAVTGAVKSLWHSVSSWFGRIYDAAITPVKKVWHDVSGWFKRVWHDVSGYVNDLWKDEKKGWQRIWSTVSGVAKTIWHDVSGWFKRVWRDVSGFVDNLWSDEKKGWHLIWSTVSGWAKTIWQDTKKFFSNLKDDVSNIIGKSGLGKIFVDSVTYLGNAWKKLQDLAKAPVSFIINTVINGGLLAAFNWVAGQLHEKTIPPVKIKGFRVGGFTGSGAEDKVAGVTHFQEQVIKAPSRRRLERALPGGLDYLNKTGMWPVGPAAETHGVNQNAAPGPGVPVHIPGLPTNLQSLALRGPKPDEPSGFGSPVSWGESQIGHYGWYNRCLAFVNAAWGHAVARFRLATARQSMNAGPRSMGGVPPAGAGVYWDTGPSGHIALAVGDGTVLSNDIVKAGRIDRVPQGRLNKWGPYRGWWSPTGAKGAAGNIPGGGVLAPIIDYIGKFRKMISGPLGKLKAWETTPWLKIVGSVPRQLVTLGLNAVKKLIPNAIGAIGGTVAKGGSKAIAAGLLPAYGWNPLTQMGPLNKLWTRESGWNVHATNPSSGAYGIPQALPASKMASAGSNWHDSALTQIRWGLGYIKSRYGSPAKAWGHETSAGWYDDGGLAYGKGLMPKNTIKPERVLSSRQTESFDRLVALLEHGGGVQGVRGPLQHIEHQHIGSNVDMDLVLQRAEFRDRAGTFG